MDKAALKDFYFSNSSNFKTFSKVSKNANNSSVMSNASTVESPAASPNATMVSESGTVGQTDVAATTPAPATSSVVSAGAGLAAVRGPKSFGKTKKPTGPPPPDAASAEYFNFLKQQQELQRHHTRVEESIQELEKGRRDRQSDISKLRRQAAELLEEIETSTDWKLKSKYNTQQLIRDCSLVLQPVELTEDTPPQLVGVQQISGQLNEMKAKHGGSQQFGPHHLFVDQGIRRMGVLEKVIAESNLDATALSRIPDTLLIHMDNVCRVPTVESLVTPFEEKTEHSAFKVEELRKQRDGAVAEGEVLEAEKACYEIIGLHEGMLANVIGKAGCLQKAIEENSVMESVRASYQDQTVVDFDKIRAKSEKLKVRCEEDIKKMYALREKVEEVESTTAAKVVEERVKSDKVLEANTRRLEIVFAKIDDLEKEVEVLERERYREIQKRVVEKDKDEHRKAEFAQFCKVVEEHTVPLERTVRNMDALEHSVTAMKEFVEAGFASIKEDLAARDKLLKTIVVEAHKQHAEIFRGLLLELGEIVYKKERMIEETDKSIQQAHVQQELLGETFNPNAKKFGTIKKNFLATRDDLEQDVKELKERAAVSLDAFRPSEQALAEAGVQYVHPVTEQEHHMLSMRAKMMEYKALAIGHTHGQDLLNEIENVKHELMASRQEIEHANAGTSGTVSTTLPLVRAAARASSPK